jgi:glycosyltransferase involved in cell wall biosynthesis
VVSRVVEGAAAVLPVSAYLAKAMQLHWPRKRYDVVPNVVDLQLFQPDPPQRSQKLRLIHISNLNYQKDPESLFQSLRRLSGSGISWELDVLGPDSEEVTTRCRQLGIEGQVHFHGEVPHPILVRFLQRSDALVLYSRYETFGCVLIEAFACGVPVIVADTDLMKEIVEEGVTGYRVPVNNPEALAHAFEKMSRFQFLPDRIVEEARKYRFEIVGQRMEELYREFERK